MSDSDPRMRPADPAGTRPRVDPETLKPSHHPGQLALAAGEEMIADPALSKTAPTDELVDIADGASAPVDIAHHTLSVHAPRFQFLFGALGAAAIVALALTVAILTAPAAKPGPAWSSWRPAGDGGDPAAQIAEHVAPLYKLSDGHQLVAVTGGPQSVDGQPVVLALRSSGSEPAPLPSNGVFYELCGAGPSCSIPGKASDERGLLVRREALELALYTFHYIGEASQVVVTFPPAPPTGGSKAASGAGKSSSTSLTGAIATSASQTPSHVLLFRPAELSAELSQPLSDSLSTRVPDVHAMNSSPDAPLVDRLTINAFYDYTLSQQESTLVMLLQAPSLDG
jgi:hypothetical protein